MEMTELLTVKLNTLNLRVLTWRMTVSAFSFCGDFYREFICVHVYFIASEQFLLRAVTVSFSRSLRVMLKR